MGEARSQWRRNVSIEAPLCLAAALALVVFAAPDAAARSAEPGGTIVYERAHFEPFAPITALDMVRRVPGFSLEDVSGARGFGATAGNVLINGVRPTSKDGGLQAALSRIPAAAVARIEAIRGPAASSEAGGRGLVLNVITRQDAAAGAGSLELEAMRAGRLQPGGQVSLSGDILGWEAAAQLAGDLTVSRLDGERTRLAPGGGAVILRERERRTETQDEWGASFEVGRPFGEARLGLAGSVRRRLEEDRLFRDGDAGTAPGADDSFAEISANAESLSVELSSDWTQPLGETSRLRLIALARTEHVSAGDEARLKEPGDPGPATLQSEREDRSHEMILRGVYSRGEGRAMRTEIGGEATWNGLRRRVAVTRTPFGGAPEPVALPAADIDVRELRSEVFGTLVWTLNDRVALELGLAAEASAIEVTGDARNEDRFFFLKPTAALSYAPGEAMRIRASYRRGVGQLSFANFAASTNLEEDRLFGGNPELQPDTAHRFAVSVDLRSDRFGALSIEPFVSFRRNVLEQVLLPGGATAGANIPEALSYGLEVEGALTLPRHWPGARLEASWRTVGSEVDDPTDGAARPLSLLPPDDFSARFRQDLPGRGLAFGVEVRRQGDDPHFFPAEDFEVRREPVWRLFAETSRPGGSKATVELIRLGGAGLAEDRRLYTPDRTGVEAGRIEGRYEAELSAQIRLETSW
ncbi:MAG: TonB-dependent receptor [Oceanicaulis sp.]